MTSASWHADTAEIEALVQGRHANPFALLGPHGGLDGTAIRAFVPGAETVTIRAGANGGVLLERRDPAGFFEGLLPNYDPAGGYTLDAANAEAAWTVEDPYRFGPVLGPTDDYLLHEGTHRELYRRLGAHVIRHEGVDGVHFAVWAPSAQRVSVVGDFNFWDGRVHQMRMRVDSGVWEIFVPRLGSGVRYKYEILNHHGALLPLKADPFGRAAEYRPGTASVVAGALKHKWSDAKFMQRRAAPDAGRAPMSIYEVHLGSWRRNGSGGFLTYDEIADMLVPYAVDLGFTHLQFLPVSEHPLDASWGYQPIGLFSPTSRFGDQEGFARLVDRAHAAGLSVILDWVPAHFPVDPHGLSHFDGTALYEHADPRQGFHPDWNTAIYNFGRREVANTLIASALYWLDTFHVDALRVDAVASMLYLDYSRKQGEWVPNSQGGNTNLEAVAFLRRVNTLAYGLNPGMQMIAEESTFWPGVSAPVDAGGLGFGFKWNMGWMNDTLSYLSTDPLYRRWQHDKLTFGIIYAFSENFILPISHDEVVHGKGSLYTRIPGDDWQKFATLRAYYGFMWAHPGKKLLFMGQEFGQQREWNFDQSLDWHLLEHDPDNRHRGLQDCIRDLNRLHRSEPALHARDCEREGFRWIVSNDRDQSVIGWLRMGGPDDAPIAIITNFTPVPREGYRIGLPKAGFWREILNTDAGGYGGANIGNGGGVQAQHAPLAGFSASATITVPPLATLYFRAEPG